ncbi:hypothetical protein BKG70_00590 [Mycobacteroides chelonae]|uniref:hypothetical protein n=1 Tax=Mycobacteroides chelonae TaxID=1774 RepID=UPI0008A8F3BF|nr:hypothetical protein [Mycobacteroides chelonae]OHT91265.1 hypothetical protein BKG70_00590 [Mycobacteroides chelonae]
MLKWINGSKENPGYSVYYAVPERDENVLYVIRQKRKTLDFTPKFWRAFVRTSKNETLRVVYAAETRSECKAYIQDMENTLNATNG